jgi:hypothetical protein
MRKFLLIVVAILAMLVLSSFLSLPTAKATGDSSKEAGVMKFRTPVRLMGLMLQGDYIFVHDDQLSAQGEACTAVYEMSAGRAGKPLITFHCTPVQREKATAFVVRMELVSTQPLMYEIREIQFAGSTEAHQVMASHSTRAMIDVIGQ